MQIFSKKKKDQERQSSRLCEDFFLTIAAIQGNPVAFGSPMPSESEPVCVEPAPEAQLDYSKVWLCKKAFQRVQISPQAWGIHSTQEINDMSYHHLA